MQAALCNYLEGLFGVKPLLAPMPGISKLPVMYPTLFQICKGSIDQRPCAFAIDRQTMHLTPGQIRQHIKFLGEKYHCPFVYVGALADPHATERMIATRTPFVAPGRALYLPFAGIVFGKENKKPVIQKDRLGGCAQLILLGFLLKKLPHPVTIAKAADILPFGKSTIDTAFQELKHFGLGDENTMPRSKAKCFQFCRNGKDLWDVAQDFLFNPCKRTVGLASVPAGIPATIAGVDALAQISMLAEMPPSTYATPLTAFRKQALEVVPLECAEIKLQLWRYDPCIFGQDRIDLLSLALSLKNDPDERVQLALESTIKEFPW